MTKTVRHEFNSLSEIPGYLSGRPRVIKDDESQKNPRLSWDDNVGYEGAMGILKNGGWSAGVNAMSEAVVEINNIRNAATVHKTDTDVTGYAVDIEAFLSGDPNCMYCEEEDESHSIPIIRVCVNIFQSASVKFNEKLNYGAAVMSVIDDIESKGARVELWASYGAQYGGVQSDLRVLLKSAEESWSPAVVSFALAHSAFARRVMFRVIESFIELDPFSGNYGAASSVRCEEDDIYFPPMVGTTCDWAKTREGALRYATRVAQKELSRDDG